MDKYVKMAINAYEKVPFYKSHYNEFINKHGSITHENFSLLPIIEKRNVQENWRDLLDNSSSSCSKSVLYLHTSG